MRVAGTQAIKYRVVCDPLKSMLEAASPLQKQPNSRYITDAFDCRMTVNNY